MRKAGEHLKRSLTCTTSVGARAGQEIWARTPKAGHLIRNTVHFTTRRASVLVGFGPFLHSKEI